MIHKKNTGINVRGVGGEKKKDKKQKTCVTENWSQYQRKKAVSQEHITS